MLCFKALCAPTKAPCVENRGVYIVGIQAVVKKPVENAVRLAHQIRRHHVASIDLARKYNITAAILFLYSFYS